MKNQLSESIEAFQSLTWELTAKVMQGWRLSNFISTLASFPGSLSLISDFKFPVSDEWEEGCQWAFLALEKNKKQPGKDIWGQRLLCLLHLLCTALLSPMHHNLWGLPWHTNQSHHPFSLQCCTHPGRNCRKEGNTALPIAGDESSSPCLRSKKHDDDYQTPFPTLILALAQLDLVIWELMLRS